MYIEPGRGTEAEGQRRIGIVPPVAIGVLASEITAILSLYPAWLTEVETHERILQLCAADVFETWVALDKRGGIEILGICSWEVHAKEKYYHVLYLGGKNLRKHLKVGLRELERYVYMNEGAEVVFAGRPAWQRLLCKFGYGQSTVMLRKNVRKSLGH